MSKNVIEIIHSEYKNKYKEINVSDDIKEKINEITIDDYEELYKESLRGTLNKDIDYNEMSLREINDYIIEEGKFKVFFNDDECIFYDHEDMKIPFENDYLYFEWINNSDFIKSMLDENSEHGVRENGHLLGSILGSVCQTHFYESTNAISMYAETWWKLNTTHPFNNGNKRTSFIGVKSKMLTDWLLNFVDHVVLRLKNENAKSIIKEDWEPIFKKVVKKINSWKNQQLKNSKSISKISLMNV